MWIGLIVGCILGSVTFYTYIVATAREPKHSECMDCRLTDCADCQIAQQSIDAGRIRRAA